ncbi:MAG: hypothetical protein ACK4ZU_04070 [Allorhizobium sp.]
MNIESQTTYAISKAALVTIGPDNHRLGDLENFTIKPNVVQLSAAQKRRQERRAAITTYYNLDLQTATKQDLEDIERHASTQSVIKRHPVKEVRRDNILIKRANTNNMLGIDLVAENAHEHGSRAIRRKVSHDSRKGTKPAPFGGGSVKLTDADIVERHGRPALGVMSAERFQSALSALWETGRRLDLKPKTEFQRTVDALADVMGRRVSV